MWCTRWFLPLVILPLPTAPPYFLAVFLLSLFLHARPCFYCMMLLTALFTSSCYWQAIPVESALTYPIGNATTFGEALRANLSIPALSNANSSSATDDASESWNVNLDFPPVVQLIDRCWCNLLSRNGLFHPGDVAAWERESVEQARKDIETQYAKHKKEKENVQKHGIEASSKSNSQATPSDESTQAEHTQKDPNSRFALRGLRDFLFPTMTTSSTPKYRLVPGHPPPPPPPAPHPLAATDSPKSTSNAASQPGETNQPEPVQETMPTNSKQPSLTDAPPLPTQPTTKLLHPYYDFRPYGLDITIDFRWNR